MKKLLFAVIGMLTLMASMIIFTPCFRAEAVDLKFWTGWPEAMPTFERAIKAYEAQHPGVKIKVGSFKLRELEQKLAMSLPAGAGPDVFTLACRYLATYMPTELLRANPSQAEKLLKSDAYKYNPLILERSTFEGKTYGLPLFGNITALWWNKKMFEEVALPGPPKYWEDMILYARKLAKYDKDGNLTRSGWSLRIAGGSGLTQKWNFGVFLAGGSIIERASSGRGWHNGYNNIAGIDALKQYIDCLHKYKVDSFEIKHDMEAFVLERTAMFRRGPMVLSYLKKHGPQVLEHAGAAPFPKYRRWGDYTNWQLLFVPSSCKNPEVAFDFAMFLLEPEWQKDVCLTSGWTPARRDINFEDIFQQIPQYRNFVQLPPEYELHTEAPVGPQDEIYTKLASRLSKAYRNKDLVDNLDGIAQVLEDAAKETDEILKKAGLYGL